MEMIKSAKTQIRVAAYSFTEPAIGKALLEASKRGVDVAVVVDRDHNGRRNGPSLAGFLASNGVQIRVTSAFKIMHNKFVVVDGETLQTGSYNYSRAAETGNAENVLVIGACPHLAKAYQREWEYLWGTGTKVQAPY